MRRIILLVLFSFFLAQLFAQINKGEEYSSIHSGFAIGKNIQNLSFSFTRNLKIGKHKNFECYSGVGFENTLNSSEMKFQLPAYSSIDNTFYFYSFTLRALFGVCFMITKKIKLSVGLDILDFSFLNKLSKNNFVTYYRGIYDSSNNYISTSTYAMSASLTSKSWFTELPFIGGNKYEFNIQYLINRNWLLSINGMVYGTIIEIKWNQPFLTREQTFLGQNISFLYGLGVSYIINQKRISP